jgi:hypothetical protein
MTCRQTPVHIPAHVVSDFANYWFMLRYVPEWDQWLVCEDSDENDEWLWVRDTTGEKALNVAEDHCIWEGAPDLRRIPEVLLRRARPSMSTTVEDAELLLALTPQEVLSLPDKGFGECV